MFAGFSAFMLSKMGYYSICQYFITKLHHKCIRTSFFPPAANGKLHVLIHIFLKILQKKGLPALPADLIHQYGCGHCRI